MSWATDYHAAVLAVDEENQTLLLIDDNHSFPLWKFPGGGGEEGETPFETAVREYEEETGIVIATESLTLVSQVEIKADGNRMRNDHTKYFFFAKVDSLAGHKAVSDDGERVALFALQEIEHMLDLNEKYRQFYMDAKHAGLVP